MTGENNRHFIYRDIADFFDQRYSAGEEVLAEKKLYAIDLISRFRPISDDRRDIRILDVGCGSGRLTEMLVRAGYKVTGVDVSAVAIEKLRQRGIDGFVHNIAEPFSIDDGTFDVVFAGDLLELVPDMFLFMSEVSRMLKKAGLFVFSAPHMAWLYYRSKNCLGYASSDLMPPSHCRFWTRHGIEYFFDNDWFSIEFVGGVGYYPWIGGKRSFRTRRLNLLCRDVVGVCRKR